MFDNYLTLGLKSCLPLVPEHSYALGYKGKNGEFSIMSKFKFYRTLEPKVSCTDAHRGMRGKREVKYRTPQANFKTLVNKKAIKPQIVGPLLKIFPESLVPLEI